MYNYTDSNSIAPNNSGAFGNFGLNTGVFLTKFEFNPNGGAGGSAKECVDITFKIKDKEVSTRVFPLERQPEDTDKDFENKVKTYTATLADIVKCFVPEDQIKTALAVNPATFKDYITILTGLITRNPNYSQVPLDLFLQYDFTIGKGADRTYLRIPKIGKTYHGLFICPSKGEGFKEVRAEDKSLSYVKENGEVHPFKRTAWFMESNFANQQKLNNPNNTGGTDPDVFGTQSTSTDNVGDVPF